MSLQKNSYLVPYRACMVENGGSAENAATDHSVTPSVFEVTSGAVGTNKTISKIIITIVSSAAAADSSKFGNLATLANGLVVKYDVNGTNVYTIGTYKSLLDLDLMSDEHYDEVVGTDYIYEYELHFETPIQLTGGHSDRLYVEVSDNLSSLNGLYFGVSGTINTAKFNI